MLIAWSVTGTPCMQTLDVRKSFQCGILLIIVWSQEQSMLAQYMHMSGKLHVAAFA